MDEQILDWKPVEPAGIGGWLMFRVIQLLILGPLSMVKLFAVRPLSVWAIGALSVGVVGAVTGMLILTQRPIALKVVGAELALTAAFMVCLVAWAGIHNAPNLAAVTVQSGVSIMTCLAWFLYFRESVRVRNTFGRNL